MRRSYQKENINVVCQQGFSLIELIIVLLIISILTVFSIISFKAERKYHADLQAYQIFDLIQEARQRALTQHSTMRIEINQTKNTISLISENEPNVDSDDKVLKALPMKDQTAVVVGAKPDNAYDLPADISPTPIISFKTSVHPLSKSNKVATLRFTRTGVVMDAGSNSVGTNAAMTGATIYIWTPNYSKTNTPLTTGAIIRAISIQGTSGLSKYWKCPVTNNACQNWGQ